MSEKFSNLWLLGKADVSGNGRRAVLAARDLNVIQFNLIKGDGLGVDALLFGAARDRECNLTQINKMDCATRWG